LIGNRRYYACDATHVVNIGFIAKEPRSQEPKNQRKNTKSKISKALHKFGEPLKFYTWNFFGS